MIKKVIGYLFLGLFLFSCNDLQDAAKNIKKVNENQDLIINKLNALDKKIVALEKKVELGAKAPSDKKKEKPKADPNKVYDIAEAGSVVLGNPDAKVSIVKWTDFQ